MQQQHGSQRSLYRRKNPLTNAYFKRWWQQQQQHLPTNTAAAAAAEQHGQLLQAVEHGPVLPCQRRRQRVDT